MVAAFYFVACSQHDYERRYNPGAIFNQAQQDSLTFSLIRYIGRLPRNASQQNKFESRFDSAYKALAEKHLLLGLYKKEGLLFFLYARRAPSLQEKYVAIAGKVAVKNGEMLYYEEVFRTWKKTMPALRPLSLKLFHEMIEGKDLTPYYTENSGDEYIIEFPSKEVYFDVHNKIWRRKP